MRSVDHREVQRLIAEGAQVVDVLPAHEYNPVHLPGAIHMPLAQVWREARQKMARDVPIVVYCRDSLCDLSARAAAQLDYLGFANVYQYPRGKADWLMRGLPTEPRAGIVERIRPLRYFINNLFPAPRDLWISATKRARIDQFMAADVPRLSPEDQIESSSLRRESPHAVVLNREGVLLGAIEKSGVEGAAIDQVNGGPQTIRPDMTRALAAKLLEDHRYILVTTGMGEYLGRYCPENSGLSISTERAQEHK